MIKTVICRFIALLFCLMSVSSSQPPIVQERELTEFSIDKMEMAIMLPSDAYVTDRTVSPDYAPLERLGMTASQLEVEFKKGDIYCSAVWFPESTDMTEIIITMTEDEDSKAIFHLADYDQLYLKALADSYAAFSQQGLSVNARYISAEVKECGRMVFIKAYGVLESEDASENHLHYMTVVNGMRIEITLVEHYSREGASVQVQRVSADNEQMMDEIINSIHFDKFENEFIAKNKDFVVYAVIIIAACFGLFAAYVVSKIKTGDAAAIEPAEPYDMDRDTAQDESDFEQQKSERGN